MTTTEKLRPELETLPARMRGLPVARGYPVPWFVSWVNGEPEFRAADPAKLVLAVRERRCWVCGDVLGRYVTFVIGPMCGINRTTAEPPCHKDCAQWSARNCPFLSRPHATRREDDFTENACFDPAGLMIRRNPGVTLLWTTREYQPFRVLFQDAGTGGVLFQVGEPAGVEWWAEGKPASRSQVLAAVEAGLPALEAEAAKEPGAAAELERMKERFWRHLPAGA